MNTKSYKYATLELRQFGKFKKEMHISLFGSKIAYLKVTITKKRVFNYVR